MSGEMLKYFKHEQRGGDQKTYQIDAQSRFLTSSTSMPGYVHIGCDYDCGVRIAISQAEAAELLPLLQFFVEHGTLPEPHEVAEPSAIMQACITANKTFIAEGESYRKRAANHEQKLNNDAG
jgi:hypothetical protein